MNPPRRTERQREPQETRTANMLEGIKIGLGSWAWGDRVVWQFGRGYGESDVRAHSRVPWRRASAWSILPRFTDLDARTLSSGNSPPPWIPALIANKFSSHGHGGSPESRF